jgi:RHO1 GDP-GTP exchange protein 1/2
MGCYITKHGQPSRNSGFIKWEVQAVSYTHRGVNVLLFSPRFIEVRNVMTGRLVQVIEGIDIRLLYTPTTSNADDTILVSMRGEADDDHGVSEKVVSLVETSEISALHANANAAIPAEAWDEWDM